MYGSIYETAPENETVVGLQRKFLFLLKIFQAADARPTEQAMGAVERLEVIAGDVKGGHLD
jgi:hypothetical protein